MASPHPFGAPLRHAHYSFAPDYLPLNNGSYGASPAAVRAAQAVAAADLESRPDPFIKFELARRMAVGRAAAADLLRCPVDDLVLIPNVSIAIDTVLRNLCGVSGSSGDAAPGVGGAAPDAWTWLPGDAVVYWEGVYPAVERGLHSVAETWPGVRLERVEIEWPMSDDEVVRRFEEAIVRANAEEGGSEGGSGLAIRDASAGDAAGGGAASGGSVASGSAAGASASAAAADISVSATAPPPRRGRVRLAVFDTILSTPGLRAPWERLCEVCRRHGVLSLVDGAHAAGIIDVDLAAARPDFFGTNLHKWLSVPRGCAAFYAAPHVQPLLRTTLPTSLNFKPRAESVDARLYPHPSRAPGAAPSAFVDLFSWTGTIDWSPYLAIPAALEFRRVVLGGEARIRAYQDATAEAGARAAAAILGTEILGCEGSCARTCAMVNVRLPVRIGGGGGGGEGVEGGGEGAEAGKVAEEGKDDAVVRPEHASRVALFVLAAGVTQNGVYFQLALYRGKWWWRISAAPYVDVEDIERGALMLKGICRRIADGRWLDERFEYWTG